MKQYTITFDVPDDFNPDEMALNVQYPAEIALADEGFFNMEELIKEKIKVSEIKPEEGKVILFTFPSERVGVENLTKMRDTLETVTGLPAIGYISDFDVLVQQADEAINMFNGMIAKLKLHSAVKETSEIVIPR